MKGLYTLAEVTGGEIFDAPVPLRVVEVWHLPEARGLGRGPVDDGLTYRERVYACVAAESLTDEQVLGLAFREFNVGDDPAFGTPEAAALEYRDALRERQDGYGTRSLSVGDEVRVDGARYLCRPVGWERVA